MGVMILPLSPEEKDRLAEENIPLVYFIIKKFQNTGISEDELESIAFVGYAKALHEFDKSRNVKFSTFAFNCIRNEILFNLRKEKKHREKNTSMDTPLSVDKNGNTLSIASTISGENVGEKSVEEQVITEEAVQHLKEIIDSLSETEKYIITHRFGINGAPVKTQKNIADYIGMSQANVSKLEKNIIEKIRRLLGSRYKIKDLFNI